MTTLIDTVDGPRPIYKARRPCAYCGALYVSCNITVKTCSLSCGGKLAKPRYRRTCHGCGVLFERKGRKRHKYCGRPCALKHTEDRIGKQRHVAAGALVWMQSWKKCGVCGNENTVGMYCSKECVKHKNRLRAKEQYTQYTQTLAPRLCVICGDITTPKQGGAKWCDVCAAPALAASKRKCRRVSKATRRARIRQLPIEKVDPYDIFARDGWRCQMCLRQVDLSLPVNHDLRPNLDHIIPVSKGGSHTRNNLQCLCRRCNMDKSDKLL